MLHVQLVVDVLTLNVVYIVFLVFLGASESGLTLPGIERHNLEVCLSPPVRVPSGTTSVLSWKVNATGCPTRLKLLLFIPYCSL